jgi:adenylate cyclase
LRVGFDVVARCGAWRGFYQLYTRRDWRGAALALADFRSRHGDDSLTAIYDERLRRFQAEPPGADWDGVIRYTQK